MPTILLRYLPYLIVIGVTLAGVGYYGHLRHEAGERSIQAKWDKEKDKQAKLIEEHDKQVAKLENDLDLANRRIRKELVPRLAAADDYGKRLAARLRGFYEASDRSLSPPAAPATGANGAIGDGSNPSRADILVGRFIGSCKKDFAKQSTWRDYYDAIPPEMKQQP